MLRLQFFTFSAAISQQAVFHLRVCHMIYATDVYRYATCYYYSLQALPEGDPRRCARFTVRASLFSVRLLIAARLYTITLARRFSYKRFITPRAATIPYRLHFDTFILAYYAQHTRFEPCQHYVCL